MILGRDPNHLHPLAQLTDIVYAHPSRISRRTLYRKDSRGIPLARDPIQTHGLGGCWLLGVAVVLSHTVLSSPNAQPARADWVG